MPFDWVTEAISRFIGALHLETEGLRARGEFDPFRIGPPPEDQAPPEEPSLLYLTAPHQLNGFAPAVAFDLPRVVMPLLPKEALPPPLELTAPPLLRPQIDPQGMRRLAPLEPAEEAARAAQSVPQPPQILTLTQQELWLSDDDDLLFSDGSGFLPQAGLHHALAQAITALESYSLPALDLLGQDSFLSSAQAIELAQGMAALHRSDGEGYGIYVNGAQTEAMPVLRDLVSAPWREVLGYEQADAVAAPDPFAGLMGGATPPVGHHVTTGGNLASNEAVIVSNGPDASMIVVGGDMLRLDLIAQLSAMITADTPQSAANQMLNAAALTPSLTDNLPPALTSNLTDGLTASPPLLPSGPMPLSWVVQRVEGDVVFSNRIEQHIFASDFDRIEAVLTAQTSTLSLGANLLGNRSEVQAFGAHYDLIVVAGDVIALNVIAQIGLIYDADLSSQNSLPWLQTGGNLLLNTAEITHTTRDQQLDMTEALDRDLAQLAQGLDLSAESLQQQIFAEHPQLSVLYIEGDLIEQNIIQQIAYLGDSDQLALAQLQARHAALEAGLHIESSRAAPDGAGDGTGRLSGATTGDAAQERADGLANDVTGDLASDLNRDFAATLDSNLGADLPNGATSDLSGKINRDLDNELSKALTLNLGDNLMVNAATILDLGRASSVMVAGQSYSDALIHQAGLVDETASPLGAQLTAQLAPLASEAVAFLAPGMTEDRHPDPESFTPPPLDLTPPDGVNALL